MKAIRSIITAFCMFSHIPMPRIEWKDDNMRFMLAAFPLVGAAEGLAVVIFACFARYFQLNALLWGAGLCLIPLLITGGIHLDGFADTMDALSSHAPMEKKRQILKDPHAGAFAVISVCAIMILNFALYASLEISYTNAILLSVTFVLSRSGSAICSLALKGANEKGLLSTFRESADKRITLAVSVIWISAASAAAILAGGFRALLLLLPPVLSAFGLARICRKEFGGISGDLSGWYLTISESAMLIMLLIVEGIK